LESEDICKQTVGNGSLHESVNDNFRVENFDTSRNFVKKTIFRYQNILKYDWTHQIERLTV